jgi:hypothetical protein
MQFRFRKPDRVQGKLMQKMKLRIVIEILYIKSSYGTEKWHETCKEKHTFGGTNYLLEFLKTFCY